MTRCSKLSYPDDSTAVKASEGEPGDRLTNAVKQNVRYKFSAYKLLLIHDTHGEHKDS
jgi:hypothetical protein